MHKIYIFTTFFFFTLAGCYINGMITTEEDIVKSTTIHRIEFSYSNAMEYNSPLQNLNQTIIKEVTKDSYSYTIYEKLSLMPDAFTLEDTVFLIADEKVLSFPLEYQTARNQSRISENTESIMKADSSEVKVVTGISTHTSKVLNIKYHVPYDIMLQLAETEVLQFRYYSGPRMITTQLSSYYMDKLRSFIQLE